MYVTVVIPVSALPAVMEALNKISMTPVLTATPKEAPKDVPAQPRKRGRPPKAK